LGDKIYYFDQKNGHSQPPRSPISTKSEDIYNHKQMMINTSPKQLSFTKAQYYSNKQFSNLYGDDIRYIEKRIKFFTENKEWYDRKGIPYQIGLLLSGLPGSSKSSCIKSIANMTKRHIINVNFANITTATQLKNLFYSDKISVYTDGQLSGTQSYYIPVDQRLYVFEEIDVAGNVLMQRCTENNPTRNGQTINDELTLMEILTILDGTMEIPGRMIIMTTNHPEVLDKALIRPGRIDVNIQFGYARANLIVEMFEGYFDQPFPVSEIDKLPDNKLSPAEISQVLFRHFDNVIVDQIIADMNETCQKLDRYCNAKVEAEAISCVCADIEFRDIVDNVMHHDGKACQGVLSLPVDILPTFQENKIYNKKIYDQSIAHENYEAISDIVDILPMFQENKISNQASVSIAQIPYSCHREANTFFKDHDFNVAAYNDDAMIGTSLIDVK
jgi:hypothetical protein